MPTHDFFTVLGLLVGTVLVVIEARRRGMADRAMATIVARENGRLDVLMVSGGEPTVHPDITTIHAELANRPVNRILLNTNGIRIAQDDALVEWLAAHRDRVEVYLQYDGRRASSYRAHRGGDLLRWKEAAVDRLSSAEVFSTLTMTASLGVNDDEIGAVILRALETPYVGGVNIQPQFGSGRSAEIDPAERLTHTGVLARLGPQTGGLVVWRDLTALPCSHPHCCSVGYLIGTENGGWSSLTSIIGHEQLKTYLGLVSNRITGWQLAPQVRQLVKQSLLGLLSDEASLAPASGMGSATRRLQELRPWDADPCAARGRGLGRAGSEPVRVTPPRSAHAIAGRHGLTVGGCKQKECQP